ncbi:MAG: response regulator receiver protein [Thermoleophilia bacterium]|nr:response regulator receiver protein [Thermoleophilia bacterium]
MIAPIATIEILLVEDNPGDVRLTEEGFAHAKLHNRLWLAPDGEAAMQMLRREERHAECPRFDLVLLDLNLPGAGGMEVLREIRADEDLQTMPVVVLSSSDAERDIVLSYQLHANCYVTKPADFHSFVDVVHAIEQFWTTVARLPTRT